jgi:predicted nuclease of predicted toxin-antitoxin system
MLRLLLDENISDEIARQVTAKRPDIPIYNVHEWEQGRLRGQSDEEIIRHAAEAGVALVTYDVNTIPFLLVRLANEEFTHCGIVFVDGRTIRSDDYGALFRALIALYDSEGDATWSDRLIFLQPALDQGND